MIPRLILDNFQPWLIQVLVIGSLGALLPALFRIRHPRSQLIYCHAVLVLCLVLPVLQPWQHHTIILNGSPAVGTAGHVPDSEVHAAGRRPLNPLVPWKNLIAGAIVLGIFARLSWTIAGLCRLRRHKLAATPLYPLPESIQDAIKRVGANASFCLSSEGSGPVTFGFVRPVVLLPHTFLSMSEAAQCGVACHELLHVRRRDWLVTVIEETMAAFFWYHPAVWWLLGQTRLSREQLVDAEVVRVISDPDSYIGALLQIAEAQTGLDLAPAPLFLRRRHLLQRMHSLVSEVPMSRIRLVSSYGVMIALLVSAGWLGTAFFPLTGLAEVKEATAPAAVPARQDSTGYVVNVAPRSYPRDAMQKGIEGTVAVELTFNANGEVIDSHVLSGPEELRRVALESALNGKYSISFARTLQVLVNFKLPGATPPLIGGTIPPPVVPPEPATAIRSNVTINRFDIRGLSEPELSALKSRLDGLIGKTFPSPDIQQAIRDSGIAFPYSIGQVFTTDGKTTIVLAFGSECKPVPTPFGTANPCARNSFAPAFVSPDGTVQPPVGNVPVVTTPSPFDNVPFVSNLTPSSSVEAAYPPLARQARVQGVVLMQVLIGQEGKVTNVRVLSGPPLLVQAAIEAVKEWVYPPQATPVVTNATVNFKLEQ